MPDFLAPYAAAVKIAAVVFGVLAGAIVGRVLASLSRRGGVRATLILGGAGVGGLVLWLAFSHLGFGPGGPRSGGDNGTLASKSSPTDQPKSSRETRSEIVRVHMLGGDAVKDNRIYMLDGQAYSWASLEPKLAEEQTANPSFHTVEIGFDSHSVDPENPAVQRLKDWAAGHGLGWRTYVPPEIKQTGSTPK